MTIHSPAVEESARHSDPRLDYGKWLRIPGPTPLPPAVRDALAREMLPHRTADLLDIISRVATNLKPFHGTEQNVLFWPGTGSAGWEISIVNSLSPGDQVIVTSCGSFGERWATVAEMFGLNVERAPVEWGKAVTPDVLEAAFSRVSNVKAVMITHNETSTGVTNPLAELATIARKHGALVLVDGVSSAGAIPVEFDAWDIDWYISGTQKAWMCPPGLSIAAVSGRALEAAEHAGFHRFFWDVRSNVNALKQGVTPSTAPESLLFALDAALTMMITEGPEQVYARHATLAAKVRAGLTELGLEIFGDQQYASGTVTAFRAPGGGSSKAFKDKIAAASGVELAVGQGDFSDVLLRFGHMGWVAEPELDATLEAIEAAL